MSIASTTFLGTAARDSGGAEVALNPFGALSVDIADATGKRYNLAPEQLATITFPAPPAAEKAAPQATLKLGRYDEATGVWILTGEAHLAGNVYRGVVGHLSVWSGGEEINNWACVRVSLPLNVPGLVTLKMSLNPQYPSYHWVADFTPTQQINAITHLPAWTLVQFMLASKTNPIFFVAAATTSTFQAVSQLPLEYPYNGCNAFTSFGIVNNIPWLLTDTWLNMFVANEQGANDYYAMIGATPAKDTLAKWRATNGMSAADDQNMVNFQ